MCALEQRSHVPTVGKQSIPLGYAMVMMTVGMVRMKLTVLQVKLEIVMNELRRFKHLADFFVNSSHIIESAGISAS